MLGPHCGAGFSSCAERGLPFTEMRGLLTVASLVQHRLRGAGRRLWHVGWLALEHRPGCGGAGPSCPAACGILPAQGQNWYPLHGQAGP